jgi:arylsulfatase A-like enzyme
MRVLYIDCDSLRPDHLGCYGYGRDTSPNIDRLASDGRRFTNCYASDVPCGPSRTALFSGRFGFHTGVANHAGINADVRPRGPDRGTSNDGEYRTLPTELRQAGYHTAMISPFPERHNAHHVVDGFAEWIDTGGSGSERADVVYERATDWFDDNAGDDDWFLHVNFWDPHTHYDTPEGYGTPFTDEPPVGWLTEERLSDHYESYGPHSARDVHHGYLHGDGPPAGVPRVPDEIADLEDYRQWIDGYDVGVRYMDEFVGRLLDDLEASGVLEDTLVIVSADHGENQGELNVYGDHQTADHWTARVPLIVSGPGVESGVDDSLRYQLDLAPTLAEFLGGEPADGWDGESFSSSMSEGKTGDDGREYVVVSQGTWACQRGVRWDDWLLLRTYHDGLKDFAPVELYDLVADPHETTNLARDRPEIVREGLSLLEDWRGERMREAATGENGGIPGAPRALVDPLFEIVREGGPYYTRDAVETYAERLGETGRNEHAEHVKRTGGVVEQSVEEYLAGGS